MLGIERAPFVPAIKDRCSVFIEPAKALLESKTR